MRETETLIEKRTSTRAFEKREVEREVVDRLKELTLRAPTAGNMVYYTILEVKDQKKKKELADICDHQPMIERAPLVWLFLADNHKWEKYFKYSKSDEKFDIPLRRAGLGDMHLCMQDAIIAAQNCVIAAEALGLGSCYVGDVIENYERLQKLFSLPAHAIPAALLIIGYSAQKKKKIMPRPDITSSVFMEDEYAQVTYEALEDQYKNSLAYFEENGTLPDGKAVTVADRYYSRKYTSDFMREMNRSAKVFIDRWLEEQP